MKQFMERTQHIAILLALGFFITQFPEATIVIACLILYAQGS